MLFKAMEKELTGNVRDATVYLLWMKIKPFETVANLTKTACAGLGTGRAVVDIRYGRAVVDMLYCSCCIVRYQMLMKVRTSDGARRSSTTAKEGENGGSDD